VEWAKTNALTENAAFFSRDEHIIDDRIVSPKTGGFTSRSKKNDRTAGLEHQVITGDMFDLIWINSQSSAVRYRRNQYDLEPFTS
jgi:hypothetical protein